jgi:nucleotide-binding universal stress UspA family protein
MFDTILVPVDDDPMSRHALRIAADLAQRVGAKLIVMHVVEPFPTYTADVARLLPKGEIERSQEEYAEALLEGMRGEMPDGADVTFLVRRSERRPWQAIVRAAEEIEADLIVMGTHGREGVVRAFLGSVAERTARHAEVPVMLVR